jgi:hypothetical protein
MPGGKFTDSLITENLKVATEYFKTIVSNFQNDKFGKIKNSGGSIGFIPFKMNFTMDGLSGIKIYNELNVDTSFLPQGYSKTTKFIVTGIDHKLSKNDWETTISTTLIPTTSNVSKITGSLKISLKEEDTPETPEPIITLAETPTQNNNQQLPAPIVGTNLIIGDSITPNFAGNTYNKANLGLSYTAAGVLWESGKGVKVLLQFANAYTSVSKDIKNVIITIGTNDVYERDQSSVKKLAERLKILFPNAKLFVIQGGYGPLLGKGKTDKYGLLKVLQEMKQSKVDTYYKDFSDNGITVITPAIGNVSDVHSPRLPIYETIGKELLKLLKR